MKKIHTFELPETLKGKRALIYFLKRGDDIVYIGETNVGLTRAFQHNCDKQFDSIELYEAPVDAAERKILERHLIEKHDPVLNVQRENVFGKEYVMVETIRNAIRLKYKEQSYEYTNHLKEVMRRVPYKFNKSAMYVETGPAIRILKDYYGIEISV